MSNRTRGDYFERRCRDTLEGLGWVVVRSAGSLGPADLVALREGNRPVLVSCKLDAYIPPAERLLLTAAALQAGARPLMASRPKQGWMDLRLVRADGVLPVPVDQVRLAALPARKGEEEEPDEPS